MKRAPSLLLLAIIALWLSGLTIYLARQEIPTGWLQGKIIAQETGKALPNAEIQLHLVSLAAYGMEDYVLRPRPDGTFRSQRLPAGKYILQASSRAHRLAPTSIEVAEGKVARLDLELAPVPPYFDLNLHQHVFTPEETPEITGHGFLQSDVIDFQLYRVDPELLLAKYDGNLRRLLGAGYGQENFNFEAPGITFTEQFDRPITQRDIEGVFHQRFKLPALKPGLYVLVGESEQLKQVDWLMVTRLGLVVKHWDNQALAYVTDLQSGEPVAGAKVSLALRGGGHVTGLTNAQGIYQVKVPPAESADLIAQAEYQGSLAFLDGWMRGGDETAEKVYRITCNVYPNCLT